MADFSTLLEIKTKLKHDLDLEQEQFITPAGLTGYINEAIDDAEALIHGLYRDYFLSEETLSLVAGQAEYSLPADIFATKIRRLMYDDSALNGVRKYPVMRLKNFNSIVNIDGDEQFRYLLKNETAGNYQFKFYPTPPSNLANVITVYYNRNAKRLVNDSDVCDIVDFVNYIYAHVTWNVARKEKLGQDIQMADKNLMREKRLMEDTLHTLMDDEDNEIRRDLSSYQDFYYNDESYFNF